MSAAALQTYVDFFGKLDRVTLHALEKIMIDDVHFVDPFNDVRGREGVEHIFRHMLDHFPSAQFTVTHSAFMDGADPAGLLHWHMVAQRDGKPPFTITGMSLIRFAEDGRVREHVDHWDASRQFYEDLPILGTVLRAIRKRIEV